MLNFFHKFVTKKVLYEKYSSNKTDFEACIHWSEEKHVKRQLFNLAALKQAFEKPKTCICCFSTAHQTIKWHIGGGEIT